MIHPYGHAVIVDTVQWLTINYRTLWLVSGSYILRGTWLHDSSTDWNATAGTVDWKLYVIAKPSVGRHHPSCNTSKFFIYQYIFCSSVYILILYEAHF